MTDKNGQPVLYIHVLNALYSLIKAVLLYYQCFVTDIKSIDFKLNPYGLCIANKTVNGKQLILIWHVNALRFFMLTRKLLI